MDRNLCSANLMGRTDTLEKTLMLERLKAGEGEDRGWDGWMASPTWWTWVWASFGRWCWTGKPSVLQFMGLQSRTRLSNGTKLNWCSRNTNPRLVKPALFWPLGLHQMDWDHHYNVQPTQRVYGDLWYRDWKNRVGESAVTHLSPLLPPGTEREREKV